MFLSGFEDELLKLAQVPYTGRLPEISPTQPAGPGAYDWAGFDRAFKAKADQVRRQREFKAKGGVGLKPPKKWVPVPKVELPKEEPRKKRHRRKVKAIKPVAKATPSLPTSQPPGYGSKLDQMIGSMPTRKRSGEPYNLMSASRKYTTGAKEAPIVKPRRVKIQTGTRDVTTQTN